MKTYEVYHNGFSRKLYHCVDLTTQEEFIVSGWSKREFNFTVTPK